MNEVLTDQIMHFKSITAMNQWLINFNHSRKMNEEVVTISHEDGNHFVHFRKYVGW